MTTLRRKLIQRFEEVFNGIISQSEDHPFYKVTDSVAELLADAALEIFYDKPKIDTAKSDPAWALFHGDEIRNEELAFEKKAFDTFERDMQTPGNWYWFPARTSDEKAWKYFREFVVARYRENPKCFQAYQTWRTQPYARGAMSNLAIKKNPENFPASWTDFLASSAMYGKRDEDRGVQLDDHGAPITY